MVKSVFQEGYGSLLDAMCEGLEIRLNQNVTKIVWSDSGVKISADMDNFEAERVIVTVPLGVLKKNKIQFEPPLSESS